MTSTSSFDEPRALLAGQGMFEMAVPRSKPKSGRVIAWSLRHRPLVARQIIIVSARELA